MGINLQQILQKTKEQRSAGLTITDHHVQAQSSIADFFPKDSVLRFPKTVKNSLHLSLSMFLSSIENFTLFAGYLSEVMHFSICLRYFLQFPNSEDVNN